MRGEGQEEGCTAVWTLGSIKIITKSNNYQTTMRCHFTPTRMAVIKKDGRDFPGGTVVKNPPAGDAGSIPGPGRSHMPWSN